MICHFCQKEVDKAVKCHLLAETVCFKCCFSISALNPEYVSRIKNDMQMTKDSILEKCNECGKK